MDLPSGPRPLSNCDLPVEVQARGIAKLEIHRPASATGAVSGRSKDRRAGTRDGIVRTPHPCVGFEPRPHIATRGFERTTRSQLHKERTFVASDIWNQLRSSLLNPSGSGSEAIAMKNKYIN